MVDKLRSLDSRISGKFRRGTALSIQIFIEVVVDFSFEREMRQRERQKREYNPPLATENFDLFE
jgi:sugar-specific transcriptional regulator TrmB